MFGNIIVTAIYLTHCGIKSLSKMLNFMNNVINVSISQNVVIGAILDCELNIIPPFPC